MPIAKLADWLAFIGIFLIQGAIAPTIFANVMGYSQHLPPLDMVIMIWIGLLFFLFRGLIQRDVIYTISNGSGLFLQSVTLGLWFFA
jgi:hypothetical protein